MLFLPFPYYYFKNVYVYVIGLCYQSKKKGQVKTRLGVKSNLFFKVFGFGCYRFWLFNVVWLFVMVGYWL